MYIINQFRTYYDTFTESELYLPDISVRYCWVLEDVGRPNGIKIPKVTCIPEGIFDVIVSKSTRWNKDMLLLHNKDFAIEKYGVRFTGIRVHGGTRTEDTDGCLICSYKSDHNGLVRVRASDDLLIKIKQIIDTGEVVKWVISS